MKNKILIASDNPHKQEKLKWVVENLFKTIELPNDLDAKLDVIENGKSFKENAVIKARAYSKIYDGYTIATDAGMLIPSLGDAWNGLYTKRFAGENATDFDRIDKLISLLKDKEGKDRKMSWSEAVAVAKNGKDIFSVQTIGVEGVAQKTYDPKQYKEGIWVCSLWYFPQWDKNFFELTGEEISQAETSWVQIKQRVQDFFGKNAK